MLALLPLLILQSPPPISGEEALVRVRRVIEGLRQKGEAQGFSFELFDGIKESEPPRYEPEPKSSAMMGRYWTIRADSGKSFSVQADVDMADGAVRSFHCDWTIPNRGEPIVPKRKRPQDAWFLARAREYASACGLSSDLSIERVEPSDTAGRGGCYDVWLVQTYQGVPLGDANIVVDARYGLLYDAVFWPTPNHPPSVKPAFPPNRAVDLATSYVRSRPTGGASEPHRSAIGSTEPFAVFAVPKLMIRRSDRSEALLKGLAVVDHALDPYPGVLAYTLTLGQGIYGTEKDNGRLGRGPFYGRVSQVTVDAQSGRILSLVEFDPSSVG